MKSVFIIQYIKNTKAYKFQNRLIYSRLGPGHVTQFCYMYIRVQSVLSSVMWCICFLPHSDQRNSITVTYYYYYYWNTYSTIYSKLYSHCCNSSIWSFNIDIWRFRFANYNKTFRVFDTCHKLQTMPDNFVVIRTYKSSVIWNREAHVVNNNLQHFHDDDRSTLWLNQMWIGFAHFCSALNTVTFYNYSSPSSLAT